MKPDRFEPLTDEEREATARAVVRKPDGSVNVLRTAAALGISRSAARYRLRQIDALPKPGAGAPPSDTPTQRRIIRLQDDVRRLTAELASAHRAAIDDDAIRTLLGRLGDAGADPPRWLVDTPAGRGPTPEVPVTAWGCWHGGEVVDLAQTNGVNEFNVEIFERRVKRLVERTIDLLRNHGPGHYPGIVVALLGDMVSGGLHPELLKTDEEEVIPATLRVRDILVWALDRMLSEFGRVYVPCVAGNHGRATLKPEFKRYVYKSFDWLIYQMLARHYDGRREIVFDIPPANEVLFRVYGQRYLAMHGDMLGVRGGDGIIGAIGPIMRGEVKVGKLSAAIGRDYDVLVMAHWHQQLWLPRAIVANTLKGYDEYARLALRAVPSTPSQPLWLVHPKWGKTAHRDVFLEDPGLGRSDAWVSVFEAEATS